MPEDKNSELQRLEAEEKGTKERLDAILEQQRSLNASLIELQQQERDAAKAARVLRDEISREAPVVCTVVKFEKGSLHLKVGQEHPRTDIINELRATDGRWFDSIRTINIINGESWPDLKKRLEQLSNVTVAIDSLAEPAYLRWRDRPNYFVSMNKKEQLEVKVMKGDRYLISRIQGAQLADYRAGDAERGYTFPLAEAWRVYEALQKLEKVAWDDGTLEKIVKIVEQKKKLDEIALKDDVELEVDLQEGNELRPFQRVGVAFIEAADGNCILGDQMGLGKTWQAVAYALRNNLRTCVICPASLKTNWGREIKNLTGESPFIGTGIIPDQYDVKKLMLDKPKWVVVNYEILGRRIEREGEDKGIYKVKADDLWPWVELINQSKFDLIVIDEGHKIKNIDSLRSRAARKLMAPHILPMTGTPVLNRPGELWPMLTMVAPDKFPSYDNFLLRYTVDRQRARNVEELRNTLRSVLLRRTKKDVLPDLPPINRMWHWHELSEQAATHYQDVLVNGVYRELLGWDPHDPTTGVSVTSILAQIMRLKQICAQDKVEHTSDLAVELFDSASDNRQNGGKGKVLIYTQFVMVAQEISRRLMPESVIITGNVHKDERTSIQDRFENDDDVHFLVATWQTTGEGINLTAADFVIFNDLFWTPANHQQCEERAYGRLNDPHPIDSYYIAADQTIENWIQKLLDQKLKVIEEVVEGIAQDRDTSIAMDLIRKIREEMGR